jgi:hypothetical protein
MNKINLQDVQLNYQLTDRIGFGLTLPILFASRRSNNSYYTLHSAGIGDAAVIGQVWLWNPKHARHGNINLGFGFLQAPSGNDHVTNNVLTSPTATAPTSTVVDHSIQPGSGGSRSSHGRPSKLLATMSFILMATMWRPRAAAIVGCCAAPRRSTSR